MADWEMIAKGISDAGRTFALGLQDQNERRLQQKYQIEQEDRAAKAEQVVFERNRAAQMADTKELAQDAAVRNAHFAKVEREDIANLALWDNDPNLRDYVENVGMAADTFGDRVQRQIYVGVNKLRDKIRSGRIEKELDKEESFALENLPAGLKSTLHEALLKNISLRDQHDSTRKLIEYYDWQMSREKTDAESLRLSYGQYKDANDWRMEMFKNITALEVEPTYQAGRQKAMEKYGIDPNQDPTKNPQWDKLIGKGGPDANLLMSYADRWRSIAYQKKMLADINEKIYIMNPMSDPDRYMRELSEAELLRQYPSGRVPPPVADPKRAFLKNLTQYGEVTPDATIPLGEKPYETRPVWKRMFTRVVGSKVPQTLENLVGGIFTYEEVRGFKKEMLDKYGIPEGTKIDIAFVPKAVSSYTKRDIGSIFYDPNEDKVRRLEENPASPSGLGFVELPVKSTWKEPAKGEQKRQPWEK